jgi:hypothetical protein
MTDGQATSTMAADGRVISGIFPGFPPRIGPRPWYIRFGLYTGLLMATPESPKGWSLNPAVVTLIILIASIVAAGAYYLGQRDAESRYLMEQLQQAKEDAKNAQTAAQRAIQISSYEAGSVDAQKGHTKEKK